MSKNKNLILVSNDDGISSKGIYALAQAMKELGDVVVYAPSEQQSAVGHAITIQTPLRVNPYYINDELFGYAVNGTPADSVKLAISTLLDNPPDVVVSGINQGANTAINVIYSGTVSAATEGTILNIPSIAFSLASYTYDDFSFAAKAAKHITSIVLKNGLPPGIVLNVNIPAVPESEIKGYKATIQSNSKWDDSYEKRIDPNRKEYFWLTGRLQRTDLRPETDDFAIKENYVSITPIQFDLTDYEFYNELKNWKF